MTRPDLTDAGIVAAAVAVAVLTTDAAESGYVPTLAFATVMTTLLGLVLRLAVTTFRSAYTEQRRVRSLGRVDPVVAARVAVLEERTRLSAELDHCVRAALWAIREELADIDEADDIRERARRIHHAAREATSELRRQLGLLRADNEPPTARPSTAPAPRLTRPTIAFAVLVAAVAALENWGYHASGEYASPAFAPGLSIPLTALAASTVVGWRVAPVTAAAVLTLVLVVPPLALGVMVGSGAWLVATLGCLAWALGSRGLRDLPALAVTAAMTAAVVASRLLHDPDNATICAVLIAVTWSTAYVVGSNRRRQDSALQRGVALQAGLDAARDEAVRVERATVARDLHDIISHAVGVIAVQAAAAEMTWPRGPQQARLALETIDRVVAEALAELDRVVPGSVGSDPPRDLTPLVERIRATGTQVRLTLRGVEADGVDPIVYRIAQESLTNAVRHAPTAAVDLLVEAVANALRVRVSDDGPGPVLSDARGFGLVGLAERVSLRGGTLRTGPGPGGRGFIVEATVPSPDRRVV